MGTSSAAIGQSMSATGGNTFPSRTIHRGLHAPSTSTISDELNANAGSKNVLVLGGSYGGESGTLRMTANVSVY